jgi:hypothetical protein
MVPCGFRHVVLVQYFLYLHLWVVNFKGLYSCQAKLMWRLYLKMPIFCISLKSQVIKHFLRNLRVSPHRSRSIPFRPRISGSLDTAFGAASDLPQRINPTLRIRRIPIPLMSARQFDRIRLRKPSHVWTIIPEGVVIKPRFLVQALSQEPQVLLLQRPRLPPLHACRPPLR